MIYTLLAIAAAGFMLWPGSKPSSPGLFVPPPSPATPASLPTFLAATAALADVRRRLAATEQLSSEQLAAIDCLQLALTAGSDQP